MFDRCRNTKTRGHAFDLRGVNGTPRGMGMKATPLIKEHALGAFKQDTTGLLKLSADRLGGLGGTLAGQSPRDDQPLYGQCFILKRLKFFRPCPGTATRAERRKLGQERLSNRL